VAGARAVPVSRGQWLLFVNPDCVIQTDTIAGLQNAQAKDPGAGMAGCLILNPDGAEQAACRRETLTPVKALPRGRPVRVLWHEHRGMFRYYRRFFREKYSLPFFWLMLAGVWLLFGARATAAVLRRGVDRAFGR